jgi:glycolate dehydrogenase FAD-binding subunit
VRGCAVSESPPVWWGAGAAAMPGTVIQLACWPADVGKVLSELRAAAASCGLDPAVSGSAGAGVLTAAVLPDADPAHVAAFVTALRSALSRIGPVTASAAPGPHRAQNAGFAARPGQPPARASAVVLYAPPAVCARVDLFGPVPSLGLMRAVKARFDPDRAMAPGRFAGGI